MRYHGHYSGLVALHFRSATYRHIEGFYKKTHAIPKNVKMNSFCCFIPYNSPDGIRAFYRVFQKCPV
jgi:hypothetical protein